MKKAFKIISIFAMGFLVLVLGGGCDIEDDDNIISVWLPSSTTNYGSYRIGDRVGHQYLSDGYLGYDCTVLESQEGACAKFKITGTLLKIEVINPLKLGSYIYIYEIITYPPSSSTIYDPCYMYEVIRDNRRYGLRRLY